MILARTDMENIPDGCFDCVLYHDDEGICYATRFNAMIAAVTGNRPDWCPLVEAKKDEEQDGTIQSD